MPCGGWILTVELTVEGARYFEAATYADVERQARSLCCAAFMLSEG